MSLEHTIIVVCIVILIVMSLIIIPFILLKIKMKRSIAFCNEKDDFLSSEPFIDHFTKIRALDLNLGKLEEKKKIENFANKNPELEQEIESIEQHRNKLGELEITLSKQLNSMRNYHKKASDNLEIKKIFPLLKILKEWKTLENENKKILNEIDEQSKSNIGSIQEIRNKLWKYRNLMDEIKTISQEWIDDEMLPEEFKLKVKELLANITKTNNKLSDVFDNQSIEEANKLFYNFKKEQYNFFNFANHISKFKENIFIEPQSMIQKIEFFIEKTKTYMNTDFDYLNLEIYFEKVEKNKKEAINSFNKMEVAETKEWIKNFYESLLEISAIINNEIKAFNFINDNGNIKKIDKLYLAIPKKFIEIKNKFQEAISIDESYFRNIEHEINNLENLLLEIDATYKTIKNSFDSSTSFVSKQFKFKSFLFLIKSFNEVYHDINEDIKNFYQEGINANLKYNRMKSLFLKILTEAKKKNIKLSFNDKEIVRKVEEQRRTIDMLIANKELNNNQLKEIVTEFQNIIIEFILQTGKKLIFCYAFIELNRRFAIRRSDDSTLNNTFIQSEKFFLRGEYEKAYLHLLESVKRGLN